MLTGTMIAGMLTGCGSDSSSKSSASVNSGSSETETETTKADTEEMLQLSGMNVLERHMFEWPLGQFRDIHIPLMMLLQGKWGAETAIRFIKELRENGFVENEKYDLFPDA